MNFTLLGSTGIEGVPDTANIQVITGSTGEYSSGGTLVFTLSTFLGETPIEGDVLLLSVCTRSSTNTTFPAPSITGTKDFTEVLATYAQSGNASTSHYTGYISLTNTEIAVDEITLPTISSLGTYGIYLCRGVDTVTPVVDPVQTTSYSTGLAYFDSTASSYANTIRVGTAAMSPSTDYGFGAPLGFYTGSMAVDIEGTHSNKSQCNAIYIGFDRAGDETGSAYCDSEPTVLTAHDLHAVYLKPKNVPVYSPCAMEGYSSFGHIGNGTFTSLSLSGTGYSPSVGDVAIVCSAVGWNYENPTVTPTFGANGFTTIGTGYSGSQVYRAQTWSYYRVLTADDISTDTLSLTTTGSSTACGWSHFLYIFSNVDNDIPASVFVEKSSGTAAPGTITIPGGVNKGYRMDFLACAAGSSTDYTWEEPASIYNSFDIQNYNGSGRDVFAAVGRIENSLQSGSSDTYTTTNTLSSNSGWCSCSFILHPSGSV